MTHFGKHITETQNTDSSIKELSAQKRLYSGAKNIFYAQCIVAVVLPVVISFIQIIFSTQDKNYNWLFVFYVGFAVIAEIVLGVIIGNKKEKAASIQEDFDCKVLNIPWNSTKIKNRPEPEMIHKYYSKYIKKNSTDGLYNWYSVEIVKAPSNIATVICQRSNCVYDFSLRKKYNLGLLLSVVTTFMILLISATITGLTTQIFLTNVILPSIPIFALAIKQYIDNCKSIENLTMLRLLIEEALSNAKLNTSIENNTIRQIQDNIYGNRILSPMLPDWVFNMLRDKLEAQMHFAVKEIVSGVEQRKQT